MRKDDLRGELKVALAMAHEDFRAKEHPSILDMIEYLLEHGGPESRAERARKRGDNIPSDVEPRVYKGEDPNP